MDYRKLAIDEIRRISELRAAEKICRDRLAELKDRLMTVKNIMSDKVVVTGSHKSVEDRWLDIIAAQSDEEKRLRNVRRRLRRFNTAWSTLSERDRRVLSLFYIEKPRNYLDQCAAVIGCSARSRVYEVRDEALINFTRAFYGEVVT